MFEQSTTGYVFPTEDHSKGNSKGKSADKAGSATRTSTSHALQRFHLSVYGEDNGTLIRFCICKHV